MVELQATAASMSLDAQTVARVPAASIWEAPAGSLLIHCAAAAGSVVPQMSASTVGRSLMAAVAGSLLEVSPR